MADKLYEDGVTQPEIIELYNQLGEKYNIEPSIIKMIIMDTFKDISESIRSFDTDKLETVGDKNIPFFGTICLDVSRLSKMISKQGLRNYEKLYQHIKNPKYPTKEAGTI